MDQAYNAHQARRKNRSSTNLQHLTLAPLTTKLPINDADMIFSEELSVQTSYTTSYIQGKSAPTTPSLLARSPSRGRHGTLTPHGTASPNLPKSKSAVHLSSRPKSGTTTPGGYRRGPRRDAREDVQPLSAASRGRTDSDWLLRAGVLISSETRESKGQAWLVSRASSTSLGRSADGTDDEDADPDMFERERIARENAIASKHASRRGSLGLVLEDEEVFMGRSQAITPGEAGMPEGYFAGQPVGEEEYLPGPDFVNLNERLEALGMETRDVAQDDEAAVRRLVTHRDGRPRTWLPNIIGWNLFSVQEKDEENEDRDEDATDGDVDTLSDTSGAGEFEGMTAISEETQSRLEPPESTESGWQDAAWLLSVASKVAWA